MVCFTLSMPSASVHFRYLSALSLPSPSYPSLLICADALFSSTPEVFPAPNRGTGTGIASFFNRVTGLCAPIVAVHAGSVSPAAPVYASGGLILAAFVAMCLFPIETRGKQSL